MPHYIPQGFLFSGISCGIKASKKKDLGLILGEQNLRVGAVYTKNAFPAAHVKYCKSITPSSSIRALIVNSGNANAATGSIGDTANSQIVGKLAENLNCETNQILTSSTGIIGEQLPTDLILSSLGKLEKDLSLKIEHFADAILTTDLCNKIYSKSVSYRDKEYSILGIAKGSGMIHPNMGTMLAYVMTDLPISVDVIQKWTEEITEKSFNRIVVDGDTSTNDTFMIMSSNSSDERYEEELFFNEICDVAQNLARLIAQDGEGAKKLICLKLEGASSETECSSVINEVLRSSLVKTAVHGNDPNWGRILAAIGNAMTVNRSIKPKIYIQDQLVFDEDLPAKFDKVLLSKMMKEKEVVDIQIYLGNGNISGIGWGCDLSKEYVTINAEYTT